MVVVVRLVVVVVGVVLLGVVLLGVVLLGVGLGGFVRRVVVVAGVGFGTGGIYSVMKQQRDYNRENRLTGFMQLSCVKVKES